MEKILKENLRSNTENQDKNSISTQNNFRFFDNRQKYLLFVSTCSEKDIISKRVGKEISLLNPSPPAVRVFDAGMGDGTLLASVLRNLHQRFPTLPFYISGKEISLEDVRLCLSKMGDRLFEHPSTVLVFTNLFYNEAPWLRPKKASAANSLVWKELPLEGNTSHDFSEQLNGLGGFLQKNWKARHSERTGNPIYDHPTVLVIYRKDYAFLLNQIIPHKQTAFADFDLVIASQPYRLRVSAEYKVEKVLLPLTQSLGKGGRLIGIHSAGNDPGMEILKKIWPDDNPFRFKRHDIMDVLKKKLGREKSLYNIKSGSDNRSIFKYEMHSLPSELESSIGTSTLFAAWNAAIYVGQIEDQRLEKVMQTRDYLDVTREVLRKHGGLWFFDESFIVSRKND